MTNLAVVLQKKTSIIELVKRFGFAEEVRVLNDPASYSEVDKPILNFLIKCTPDSPSLWKIPGWLGVKLAEILDCEVKITILENVKSLYKNYVIDNSASLEDVDAICKLFGVTSSDEVALYERHMAYYPSVLKHANQYLNSLNSLDSLAPEEKKLSEAENLSKHAVVCEAETDTKKRKVDSSGESDSPNQGSTESPLKNDNNRSNTK